MQDTNKQVLSDQVNGQKTKCMFSNHFIVEHIRDNVVLSSQRIANDVKTAGLNYLLDAGFRAQSPIAAWYIGIINNTPTPTELAADTLASHTGWVELIPGTDFTGDRLQWVMDAASGGAIESTSNLSFPMLTTKTAYGLMLASVASGTTGTLWCTAAFDNPISVVSGDTISVRYAIELT